MDLSPRWLRLLSKGGGSVFVDSLFIVCGAMGLSAAGGCVFPNHTHLLFDIFIYIITFRCHILIKRVMRS